MELTLDSTDLKTEFSDIGCSATRFEHFNERAQTAIRMAGYGMFRSRDNYNRINSPKLKAAIEPGPLCNFFVVLKIPVCGEEVSLFLCNDGVWHAKVDNLYTDLFDSIKEAKAFHSKHPHPLEKS